MNLGSYVWSFNFPSLFWGVMFYRHLSIHRRVTPVVVITDMRKCETPQILHHQIKCCGDLIVLKTNTVTAQVTIRPKMCIFTELERGMVVSSFFVETFTYIFLTIAQCKIIGGNISSLQILLYGCHENFLFLFIWFLNWLHRNEMLTGASKNGFQQLIIRECIYEYSLPNALLTEGNSRHFPKKKL